MPFQTRTCSIDRSEHGAEINALLASGVPLLQIERDMKSKVGYNVKRETIKRHLDLCLLGRAGAGAPAVPQRRRATTVQVPGVGAAIRPEATKDDIAVLVQKEIARRLRDPDQVVRMDVKDGLAAQALLDKRAEKEKDRSFMMNLARLLSGAGVGAPEELIEGEYEEVDDDQLLLAPPELRDGS